MGCHEQVLESIVNFCSDDDSFCKCYYVDVLIHHCTKFCSGINGDTYRKVERMCPSMWEGSRPVSGLIVDYGGEMEFEVSFIRDSLI